MSDETYGRRKPQIKKPDLYMLTALWMEQSPWAMKATDKERVVGAVFVRPNDRVLSVDCSRSNEGGKVHGAIRALIQYPDQVEGCYVYLSRQPCAHCVKMLVQAAVKKVFYLPLKPEKDESEENKSIDALFKVSPVSREVYVPNITGADLEESVKFAKKKNMYGIRELGEFAPMFEWKESPVVDIGWDECSDASIKKQVDEDMARFSYWFDMGILATGKEKEMKWRKEEPMHSCDEEGAGEQEEQDTTPNQGTTSKTEYELDTAVANHLSRLAQLLSYQTDDPDWGVGCVIALKDEIVAIGWNGFPSKALYGNHPRSSRRDPGPSKYPHIIHALDNAILSRNRRDLEGCVVYHTIPPSDDGMSILYQMGAKALVLPSFKQDENLKNSKPLFYDCLQKKKLIVFNQTKDHTWLQWLTRALVQKWIFLGIIIFFVWNNYAGEDFIITLISLIISSILDIIW